MENENLQTENSSVNMGAALGSILQNPELMEKIRSIVKTLPGKEAESTVAAEVIPAATQEEKRDIPDGLSAILGNPDMMAKLPQILSVMKPLMDSGKSQEAPRHRPHTPEEERNELLCSLKPFLSPAKRETVDAMLRISKLGKVLKDLT